MPHACSTRLLLLPALTLSMVTGCAERPTKHTVKKVPAETASEKPADVSVGESQLGAFAKTKAEFEKELTASLDKLDSEIQELKAKAANMQADAREKVEKAIAEVDTKQKAAREKLAEVQKSSEAAWDHLKQGSRAAWGELEKAVKKAAKEF